MEMAIVCSWIELRNGRRGITTIAEAQLSLTESFSLPAKGFHVSHDERGKFLAARQAGLIYPDTWTKGDHCEWRRANRFDLWSLS